MTSCYLGDAANAQPLLEGLDEALDKVIYVGGQFQKGAGEAFAIAASGNAPFIVMPFAPLDVTARGAAFGAFLNCGQVCISSKRFYSHAEVYHERR